MAKFTGTAGPVDFENFDLSDLDDGATKVKTATQFRLEVAPNDYTDFIGTKFVYGGVGGDDLISGIVTRIASFDQTLLWDLSGILLPVATAETFIAGNNGDGFLAAVFAGNDSITGSSFADRLIGFAGKDTLTGNDGNDTLDGGAGIDRLVGGKGDDLYIVDDTKDVVVESLTLVAGGGLDLVQSSATYTLAVNVDNLVLTGGAKIDGTGNAIDNTLTGNGADNKLTGLAGNDSLTGLAGNDTLDGGTNTATGGDTMVGDEGDDLYVQDSALDQIIDEQGSGSGDELKTNQSLADTLGTSKIEHYTFTGKTAISFTGSAAGNRITGTALADSLVGGDGDDTLNGLGGNDTLVGGDDNDVLDGGTGVDIMQGGDGDDIYVFDNAKDSVDEALPGGDDTVRSFVTVSLATFANIENIELTGTGALNATGNDGKNKITGNSGANKLDGLAGDDTMDGGKGNDTYTVDSSDDQMSETNAGTTGGTDTVLSTATFTLTDNIENLKLLNGGLDPNINATGNKFANILTGNDGKNVLDGGLGIDKLIGGKGDDTYIVDDTKDTVTEAANAGTDLVQSKATFTLGSNVEHLQLLDGKDADGTGNTLNNVLTGNDQKNKLSGLAGNDSLTGDDGNDTLDGGAGDDTMTGGDGDDLYVADTLGDLANITETGTDDGDQLKTSQLLDEAIAGIEHYTFTGTKGVHFTALSSATDNRITGTAAADTLIGLVGNDTLAGLAGNDWLVGGDDDDRLDGGTGIDIMQGGKGDDTYIVDNVKDIVDESDGDGNDVVQSTVSYILGGGIENLTLLGKGALNGTGDNADNVITGGDGANKLDGKVGADTLIGGKGNDIYTVDNLGDKVTEAAGEGTDLVLSGVDFTLGDNLENLTLTGSDPVSGTGNGGNNIILGNAGKNTLTGGDGNDTLTGNGGDDSLVGGAGTDSLTGGDGNDTLDGGVALGVDNEKDKMAGGAGDDTYIVSSSFDVVTEAANAGHDTVRTSVGHTLEANVEDMELLVAGSGIGNALNNKITGSDDVDKGDFLNGLAGNDAISGGAGDDTLAGFSGNDTIDGGEGVDTAQFAGKIDDYDIKLDGKGGATVTDIKIAANGNDGVDTVVNVERLHFLGDNVVFELHAQGTPGNDTVSLSSAPDGYDGLGGNDSIDGDGGNDTLDGGDDNDTLIGGTGADVLSGGTGADEYRHSGTAADGNDIVQTGDDGVDKLVFTTADLFDLDFVRNGNDLVVGAVTAAGTGFDGAVTIKNHYLDAAIGSVVIDTQFNSLYGSEPSKATFIFTTDVTNGVNNTAVTEVLIGNNDAEHIVGNGGFHDIMFGGGGNDTIDSGSSPDLLSGGAGNDKLFGNDGNDTLRGNGGDDTMNGGDDIDQADYRLAAAGVVVDLLAGAATNDGDGGQDTLIDIENVRGSSGNDKITGNAADNVFEGGAGNDTIDGGEGRDQVVYSGALSKVTINLTDGTASGGSSVGEDSLVSIERVVGSQFGDSITGATGIFAEFLGGKGNDTIDGAGNGYAAYSDSTGGVTANLATGTATGDVSVGTDKLTNLFGLSGSAFNDSLTGNASANWFEGGKGNDTIDGGGGTDEVDYSASTSGVTVDLGLGTASDGLGGTDKLTNIESVTGSAFADKITGSSVVNTLEGLAGNDTLTGALANDTLTGGAGNDSLTGGDGADTAVFSGDIAGYLVTFDSLGGATVKDTNLADGDDGTDTLSGVETLQFANGSVTVDQPPSITSTAFSVVENGKTVGTVVATDPDAGDTLTYSISGGADAAKFNIDSLTGALAFATAPDFETPTDAGGDNVYDIVVKVTDGVLSDTQAIAVTVTNANEPPSITSGAAFSIAENITLVGAMTATDPDLGDTVTFSISGTDAALFNIDSVSGALSFKAAPNFENPGDAGKNNVYDLTVTAKDSGGLTDVQAIAVTVTNVNEAPLITSNGGGPTGTDSVVENTTAVTTVTATDVDAGTTLIYSIAGGADAAKFTIDSLSGALSFVTAPNFEAPTDVGANNVYDVIVQASDGTLTDTQTLAVTITNANEAPAITSNGGGATGPDSVAENTTAVTTVTATDVDAGTTLVYSINGGADAAKFSIDSVTGALSFIVAPNFEAPTDVGANNVYDVIVQASDGTLTDTQALAVSVVGGDEAPIITSNGGGATGTDSVVENTTAVTTVTATDADAGTTLVYSISGGADAAKFSIDSVSGALAFIVAPNFEVPTDVGANNVYDVIVQASDGTLADTQALAVTVTNVNEAPVITSNGGAPTGTDSVVENTTAVTTVTATDVDAGTTLVYSISGGVDAAKFTIDSVSGALSFTAAPNFEAPTDVGANNVYDVIVQASDGTLTDTQALAVSVTAVNEAPNITTTAFSIAENTTLAGAVVVSDPDAGDKQTFSITGGADAAKFSIDSATGALSFLSAPNFEAPGDAGANNVYDVIVTTKDSGGLTDAQSIAVTVTGVNEAPSITTTALSIAENTTLAGAVVVSDPDAGDKQTFSITGGADAAKFTIDSVTGALSFLSAPNFEVPTDAGANNVYDVIVTTKDSGGLTDAQSIAVTVTDANEAPNITTTALSIAENTTLAGTVVVSDPDAGDKQTFSITGGADAAKFTIDSVTGALSFLSAPNVEAPTDVGGNNVYDVIVTTKDSGGLTDAQSIAVTVTDGNETPNITTTAFSIAENTTLAGAVVVSDPDAGDKQTFSITGGADAAKFSIDFVTGALSFLSAPNFEAPTDVGANNVYDVIVTTKDSGGLTDAQSIAVTVTGVNEAPNITTTAFSIAENTTLAGSVAVSDPDAGDKQTFSITGGADAAKFTIDSLTGALSFATAPNFEAPTDVGTNNVYDVIVQTKDSGGLTDSQSIAVTVDDVNEVPNITTTALSLDENTKLAGTVLVTDPDAGDKQTFSITGGADAAKFTIDSLTGALSFATAPNFEAPTDVGANNVYDVIVTTKDTGGLTDAQSIAVTVTGANEGPNITTTAFSIAENTTLAGAVAVSDPDAGDKQTFSITGGADAAKFSIDFVTGALSFLSAPNFEAPGDAGTNNVYDVIVTTKDSGGLTDAQSIAVTVTGVNEAPNITTTAFSIAENTTLAGAIVVSDPDAGDTQTFSITGGADAAKFSIDSVTGALSFLSAPNFEAPTDVGANNVYDVIVTTKDSGGLTDAQSIAVTVTGANEVPNITSTTFSIAENGALVGTILATDPDASTTLTYSISDGTDKDLFTINSSTGLLSFKAAPDFESPLDPDNSNHYDVEVQVTDGSLIDKQHIEVVVTDVNEAPAITSNGGGSMAAISVAENTTAVTTVVAIDPELTSPVYSISGGADAAKFSIDSVSGALSFVTAPNFEAPTDVGANNVYDVTVKVSDGSLSDTQDIAVTVTSGNEAPNITTTALSLDENTKLAGTVAVSDPDAGDKQTFSITGGADAAKFSIDSVTGALSFLSAPNFETPTDVGANNVYDVIVQTKDSGGLTDSQSIAVTVDDVNEVPNITTTALSLDENTKLAGTVLVTDPDAGDKQTFSITGGVDAAKFTIDSLTGALSFATAPNFEAPTDVGANNVYDVIVQTKDSGGLTDSQSIAVTVDDVNEAPNITTTALSLDENTKLAGTVLVTDPDAGDKQTFSITGGADAAFFSIDSVTGALSFDAAPDFETPTDVGANNVYDVIVQTKDSGGLTDSQSIAVAVTDVTAESLTGDGTANKLVGGVGDDSLSGAGGNDTLIGGIDDDTLDGGADNDSLDGGAGIDSLLGGLGDDTLLWDAADASLDGGGDTDTLLVQSISINLSTTTVAVANIERIDFGLADAGRSLTLDAQDVLDATDLGNTLTIDGDTADTVNLDLQWAPGTPSGGQTTYTQTVGLEIATLVIDSDIQVVQS